MIDSCANTDDTLITIEEALVNIEKAITPIVDYERITLKQATGRILSETVSSPINIPREDNSAMDGYAFSSLDITPNQSFSLNLVGASWAGQPYDNKLNRGECVRIFTGGIIPAQADSVIMQEHVSAIKDKIIFPPTTNGQQNIRFAGGDIKQNTPLLQAPKKLSAADLGLMASAGIYDIQVQRKLNIAFFSTGNELRSVSQTLTSGQIYDSNRYTLSALLNQTHINTHDLGVIADNKTLLEDTVRTAAKTNDVMISTGGASVGEADFIKEILDRCGHAVFWKIAIKPGKPLIFGKIEGCYFFGLPGNPVSILATFDNIVAPALQFLTGTRRKQVMSIQATCNSDLFKQPGRQEYQRGILSQDQSGEFFVQSAGKQGSNIMSAMSQANCYIVLPINSKGVKSGEQVRVEPFDTWL